MELDSLKFSVRELQLGYVFKLNDQPHWESGTQKLGRSANQNIGFGPTKNEKLFFKYNLGRQSYLSIFLAIYLHIYLIYISSIFFLSIYLPIYHIYLSFIYLSSYPPTYQSSYLSIYLYYHLSIHQITTAIPLFHQLLHNQHYRPIYM